MWHNTGPATLFVLAASLTLALLASAPQADADDYRVAGSISGTIGAERVSLWMVEDPEDEFRYGFQRGSGAARTIVISAVAGEPGVTIGWPQVRLIIRGTGESARVEGLSLYKEDKSDIVWTAGGGKPGGEISSVRFRREGAELRFWIGALTRPIAPAPPELAADGDPVVRVMVADPVPVVLKGRIELRD